MRRLIVEEPVSRAATWAPRFAWLAVAVTAIATALVRFGVVDVVPGLAAVASGLFLAGIAVLLSCAAFIRIWTQGHRGFGAAAGGLFVALLVLAYPAFEAARALMLPPLTDITTDLTDPPAFSRSRAALGARNGLVPATPPAGTREVQRLAYPRVASLTLDVAAEEAFALARRAAERRGWRIVEMQPPGGRSGLGRIEGVTYTFVLKLPIDVTVRVRPLAEGTRIDMRSATRIGPHDVGANAAVIQRFFDEVSTLALAL